MNSPILRLAARVAGILPESWRQTLYRTGPFAVLLRRMLARAAPEELTEVEVAAGPLRGARLSLNLKSEKSFWLGNYEPQLMRAIERFGRPGMVAYDVGANIGYLSLVLARRAGADGSVVAFEPLPINLARLRRNLAINPEGQRVSVVEAAVADRSGQSEFLVHSSTSMGRLSQSPGWDEQFRGSVSVDQLALDDWYSDRNRPAPTLVKIDVEGAEALVLRGMPRLLATVRPVLLLELHEQTAAAEALAILDGAEYRVCEMRSGYPEFGLRKIRRNYVVGLPQAAEFGPPGGPR